MTGPRAFTADHAAAVLAYAVSVDDRLRTDESTAAARIRAWATILGDVDPAFAMQHTRWWYSRAGANRITPGEIRTAWHTQRRREDNRRPAVPPPPASPPADLRGFIAAVRAAVAAGRDPGSVPPPRSAAPFTRERDRLTRRCVNWRTCPCEHYACRDGWLDMQTTVGNALGRTYPAVERCPHCHDAAMMALDLAGGKR